MSPYGPTQSVTDHESVASCELEIGRRKVDCGPHDRRGSARPYIRQAQSQPPAAFAFSYTPSVRAVPLPASRSWRMARPAKPARVARTISDSTNSSSGTAGSVGPASGSHSRPGAWPWKPAGSAPSPSTCGSWQPGNWRWRHQRKIEPAYSIRSFAFASAAVCPRMLEGSSGPPRFSGTM
jgi:hypothetical protein